MYMVFVHACPKAECPVAGAEIRIVPSIISGSAFNMPKPRCVFTENQLKPVPFEGKMIRE